MEQQSPAACCPPAVNRALDVVDAKGARIRALEKEVERLR
jgi:hypothetical protein